jgi:hypothetical protein
VCISIDRVASLPALTKEILRYFLEHPEATDDLEGISRWRLRQKNSERSSSEVNEALQWLVERGYLERLQPRGTRPTFRMAPGKREAARELLGEDQ